MARIGLFFGSFNPIHNGHLMLAQYMVNFANVDEVWFVVSPQNPFKINADLADAEHRLNMAKLAISNSKQLNICDIELSLPTPSYTVDTLFALTGKYPQHVFSIIMGGDNLAGLTRWKEYETILANHEIIVYPRTGCATEDLPKGRIAVTEAPQIDISSTMLRRWIAAGKSVEHFTTVEVCEYIRSNGLYR